MTYSERESSSRPLIIRSEAEAWQIHQENQNRAELFKLGLQVATFVAVVGEAAVGAAVHPAVCGLVPFTIAASFYAYRRIDQAEHEKWLEVWLRPHRTGVGAHGETEAMLAMNANPINTPQISSSGE